MNLSAGQQGRHRYRKQKCGHRRGEGRGRGGKGGHELREQYGNIHITTRKIDNQWECVVGPSSTQCCDNPQGKDGVRGGRGRFRKERTYVTPVVIHADVWQRPTKYNAIIRPLKETPTKAPSSHHIELPPDGRPFSQGRGDLLYEREVTWDDRFMLPRRRGKGRDGNSFIKQKGTLSTSHAGHSTERKHANKTEPT